jgi:histidinol dehydrogenase
MKIIEAKNLEINRAATIDAKALKIVKKFNSLLKNKSFDGLSEINESLSLTDYKTLKVNKNEINNSGNKITDKNKQNILEAIKNITFVSKDQLVKSSNSINPITGLSVWNKVVPIDSVGLYIPGGTAPLISSLIMQLVPAKVAGCKKIVICTPPQDNGKINPAILWIAKQFNVFDIYKIGGAQAILSLSNGYLNIPKVNKIFGPGNKYVSAAKSFISSQTSIDLIAGPSEVMVVVNDEANIKVAAYDLLSQLEHGIDSDAVVISKSIKIFEGIKNIINKEIKDNPNIILEESIKNIRMVISKSVDKTVSIINNYAPEHLVLLDKNFTSYIDKIENAGSVFCGRLAPVAFGDYASGTNHVLPTNGWAKSVSGLSVNDFIKKISFQNATDSAFNYLSEKVISLTEIENLPMHAKSITVRDPDTDSVNRSAFINRQTNETSVYATVDIDGSGLYEVNTGINFLDHMLEQFSRNSKINIFLKATGDISVDTHHSIEDVAIVLGQAINNALGNRENIKRYSNTTMIMDECSANIQIDLCSRINLKYKLPKLTEYVGDLPTEMVQHFIDTFIKNLGITAHVKVLGENSHHIVEILFKALGMAIGESVELTNQASSTKGIL